MVAYIRYHQRWKWLGIVGKTQRWKYLTVHAKIFFKNLTLRVFSDNSKTINGDFIVCNLYFIVNIMAFPHILYELRIISRVNLMFYYFIIIYSDAKLKLKKLISNSLQKFIAKRYATVNSRLCIKIKKLLNPLIVPYQM